VFDIKTPSEPAFVTLEGAEPKVLLCVCAVLEVTGGGMELLLAAHCRVTAAAKWN